VLERSHPGLAEFGYHRTIHSETGETPLARWAAGPDVLRPSPDGAALRLTFARTERRSQRRSDGTVVIDAHRFEVPSAFRHLDRVLVRYARWTSPRCTSSMSTAGR